MMLEDLTLLNGSYVLMCVFMRCILIIQVRPWVAPPAVLCKNILIIEIILFA